MTSLLYPLVIAHLHRQVVNFFLCSICSIYDVWYKLLLWISSTLPRNIMNFLSSWNYPWIFPQYLPMCYCLVKPTSWNNIFLLLDYQCIWQEVKYSNFGPMLSRGVILRDTKRATQRGTTEFVSLRRSHVKALKKEVLDLLSSNMCVIDYSINKENLIESIVKTVRCRLDSHKLDVEDGKSKWSS